MALAPMHYPRYDAWLERAFQQIQEGTKHCLTAIYDGALVGTLTWQTDPLNVNAAELKNLRVAAAFRGAYLGFFLLKCFERQASATGHLTAKCDMGEHSPAYGFMCRMGWHTVERRSLYETTVQDIVMARALRAVEVLV